MQPSIYESLTRDAIHAAESLSAMMEKEQTIYMSRDYLNQDHHHRHPSSSTSSSSPKLVANNTIQITESDRLKLVDWCYNVVDQLEFDREIVAMTMELVDRFLSTPSNNNNNNIATIRKQILQDRRQYQLLAISSLYLTIKTTAKVVLGSEFFSALSHNSYTIQEIEDMEYTILASLKWRIHAPTPIEMAHSILALTLPATNLSKGTWGYILDEVRFQTEYAVRDYYFTTQRRSTIALAAIFNTLDQIGENDRRAVLRALFCNIAGRNLEFDLNIVLVIARTKLQGLVEGNDAIAEDVEGSVSTVVASSADTVMSSADTVVSSVVSADSTLPPSSSPSREVADVCSSLKRGMEDSCEEEQVSSKRSAVISQDGYTVACCRRDENGSLSLISN